MNSSLQETYNQIWNDNVKSVRNLCYAKLKGCPEDAEDMLQEAFGLLWKKMLYDRVPQNPKAWLLITVKNLAYQKYKHNAKERDNRSSAPLDEAVYLPRHTEDITDTLEREEKNAKLWKALDEGLTNDEKAIIIYDKIDGVPQAKIAQMFGKKPGSTRVQIHRLNKKLNRIKQKAEKI